MGKKTAKIKQLKMELLDCRQSHAVLSRGIKKALKLKNWPDFGSESFCESVAHLLNKEVDKLRALKHFANGDENWYWIPNVLGGVAIKFKTVDGFGGEHSEILEFQFATPDMPTVVAEWFSEK